MIFIGLAGLATGGDGEGVGGAMLWLIIGAGLLIATTPRFQSGLVDRLGLSRLPGTRDGAAGFAEPPAPLSIEELQERAARAGGGAYLATDEHGAWITAPSQAAVLVLAGPRAGKTSSIVIPALAVHPGPAVATSTKAEILHATQAARQHLGTCWYFDLDGEGRPPGTRSLRWSPITRARDWQAAQTIAEQMTGAADTQPGSDHWSDRASALIAAMLHAAALGHLGMREVISWTLRHDGDSALAELAPDSIAYDVLAGINRTADRERAGIYSTASRVLRAYTSDTAMAAATDPTFDPQAFVASRDTIYIAAPAQDQRLLAPLVVGLLSDIRHAAYAQVRRQGLTWPPLLLMLDECANVAPIPDLPAMLSEAGGQGIHTVCVFQDMSQARRRWPRDADGMLSLFGARVILTGVADTTTLQQLSLLCGDYDKPISTTSRQTPETTFFSSQSQRDRGPTTTESWTTRRERRMPPDRIAQLPRGQALVMIGPQWALMSVVPYDRNPWLSGTLTGTELSPASRTA